MNFCQFFSELWFRIKLYYFGIHFYEVKSHEGYETIHDASYMFDEVAVRVAFKRIPCQDLVLKKGKLMTADYDSYAIMATFSEEDLSRIDNVEVRKQLDSLQNKAFFFNGYHNRLGIGERRKLELITDVYMDFLSELIRKHLHR